MNDRGGQEMPQDSAADILYLVDQLEELVSQGKRVPFSTRVMVEEDEFLSLVDQLREALPNEIKQARRVIKERERIIAEAQDNARKIIEQARVEQDRLISQHGITIEARHRSEELLRQAEEERQRARGEIDVFIMEQIGLVESSVRRGMALMEDAVEQTLETIEQTRDAVGRDSHL